MDMPQQRDSRAGLSIANLLSEEPTQVENNGPVLFSLENVISFSPGAEVLYRGMTPVDSPELCLPKMRAIEPVLPPISDLSHLRPTPKAAGRILPVKAPNNVWARLMQEEFWLGTCPLQDFNKRFLGTSDIRVARIIRARYRNRVNQRNSRSRRPRK